MPSQLSHTRHPTTFISLPRDTSEHVKNQRYLVVDSQNEDQISCKKSIKYKQSNIPSSVTLHNDSIIMKQRGDFLTNLMSFQIYPKNKSIDFEIKQTENQISSLQKQCLLLQGMINDMAVERGKIQVEIRGKQRRLTAQKQQKGIRNRKNCPIHTLIDSKLQNANQKIGHNVKESVFIQQIQPQISLTTPILTVNLNRCKPIINHNQAKTVDINKCAIKGRQNSILMQQKNLSNKRKVKKVRLLERSKQNNRFSRPKKKV